MKNEIEKIVIADGGEFAERAKAWLELKAQKDNISKRMDEILEELEEYTGVDKSGSTEGKRRLVSGDTQVDVTFKLTRSVDNKMALEECDKHGLNPLRVFNCKFEYATKKQMEEMTEEEMTVLRSCTTTKRAKSALEIKIKGEN